MQGALLSALETVAHAPIKASTSLLDNGRVCAHFDKKGRIRALSLDGHPTAVKGVLGDLAVYPDLPHTFDAWELDRQTLSLGKIVETPAVPLA